MRVLLSILFISVLVNHGLAQTDSSANTSSPWDKFTVSFGGFLSSQNSDIRLASKQVGLGLIVDFEDLLGMESTTFAFRAGSTYRFGKNRKHMVELGYFGINRNSSKILEEEVEIGDEVFPVGAQVSSTFNFTIVRTKYDYTYFQDDRITLGASFGFYIVPIKFTVSAQSSNGQQTSFIAPLPLVGLRSNFKITEKFFLNQSVEFLYLAVSNYEGGILDLNISLEHKTFKNVAFGLGINSNRLSIAVTKEDSPIDFFGNIGMEYTGMLLYAKYYF